MKVYPCNNCGFADTCYRWEATPCCKICEYLLGKQDCSNCDIFDIGEIFRRNKSGRNR